MNVQEFYSREEVEQRLGISTHVLGTTRLRAETIAQIRNAGIRNIELCAMSSSHYDYLDRRQTKEIMNECRKQGVKVVSFHGADPIH